PLFSTTTGLSWNHDLPTLCTLLAFLAMRRGWGGGFTIWWALVSGACAGIAIGLRLTFAPVPPALLLMSALYPGRPARQRLAACGGFLAGMAVGLAPLAALFII